MPPLQRSDPYPWPWDADVDEPLDATRIALLCVAVQPSFTAATVDAEAVTVTIGLAARALRQAGAAVVCVTVGARPHPLRPSPLRAARPEAPDPLIAAYSDAVIASVGIDGFYASPLEPLLRELGRDRLVLCGLGAETAVDSTLRSANDRGFECLTLVDAVAPHSPEIAAHAHSSVTMSGGIFGAIGTTADLLGAIGAAPPLPDANGHPAPALPLSVAPEEVSTP
ncbi:MAG: cysteine hydrolase family protein [Acidimicrobiia bacterium]|jgi:nicotinamidase-related amidase